MLCIMMEVLFNLELQSSTNATLLCLQELLQKGDGGWREKMSVLFFG